MKNANIILNVVFGFAIIILFVLNAGKKNETIKAPEAKEPVEITTLDSAGNIVVKTFPVAYIVVDSVMQNYGYYKKIEKQYQALVQREEANLQKQMENLYQEGAKLQEDYQRQLITTQNAQIKQQELAQKEQGIMQLQQSKGQELALKEQSLMKELLDSVKATIKVYNADGRFEIILNNAFNSSILHANDQLNITDDILQLMNSRYETSTK